MVYMYILVKENRDKLHSSTAVNIPRLCQSPLITDMVLCGDNNRHNSTER